VLFLVLSGTDGCCGVVVVMAALCVKTVGRWNNAKEGRRRLAAVSSRPNFFSPSFRRKLWKYA
jgi:hypothetical protein